MTPRGLLSNIGRVASLAFCYALIGSPPSGAASATDFRGPRPHPAVARVIVPEGAATSYGTGTLIDVRDDFALLVTNWHVVRDARGAIEVLFPNGQHSKARALKVDPDWDLAALVIWRPDVEPVSIAATPPQPGDELTICGYGTGIYRAVTGQCTGYYSPTQDLPQQMVELDVQARQGDSGGPIFNGQGELAGVLFGAGHGTTLGSFSGRVGTFLGSLAPDIGQRPLVRQSPQAGNDPVAAQVAAVDDPPETSEAATPAEPETLARRAADDLPWQNPAPEVEAAWKEASATQPGAPVARAVAPNPSRPIGQANWFAHLKSILAAIGVVAIVAQLLRVAR